MSDATSLYTQLSFSAACPDGHTDDEQPKIAGDQTDFGGGGTGNCTYWRDPQNGRDQYLAQIKGEIDSGMQHEGAATTDAEADYYHGYVQGLYDGSIGK
jgi:hypothetical protein